MKTVGVTIYLIAAVRENPQIESESQLQDKGQTSMSDDIR
jgi:hypothetical protein